MRVRQDRRVLESLTDEELAQLSRDGSEDAFVLLMQRCSPMIQQHAARYQSAWQGAEDLAQEGLVGLLSAVRTFRADGGASFRTYASVCIRHRMITAVKRVYAAREVPPSEQLSLEEEAEWAEFSGQGQADPAQLVVQQEDTNHLLLYLRRMLTPLEYEVLMRHLAAYSYEEIAKQCHVHVKAVDNALQRVRRKLAVAMPDRDA